MMDSESSSSRPSGKRALLSLLVLLALTVLMFYLFKDHLDEIQAALKQITLPQALLLLALGASFPLLDGLIAQQMLRSRKPDFTYRQGVGATLLGTFGNVVTFGAGTLPMQGYYLYRCGVMVGPGVGLLTLAYVFHKTAVLLYGLCLLFFQMEWFLGGAREAAQYLLPACAVVAAIILALILVCASARVQGLVIRAMNLLPKSEAWQKRRAGWTEQLNELGGESRRLLANKPLCLRLLGIQLVKLSLLYTIPWLGIRFMGLEPLGFWQTQMLAALMMLLSNALPNVAGMGSIETAFLLVFQSFLGASGAMSALVLYRLASYYLTFAMSAVAFFLIQHRLGANPQDKA